MPCRLPRPAAAAINTTTIFKTASQVRSMFDGLVRVSLTARLLSSCSPPSQPLHITKITVSPEPKVGEIVTLQVEVMADNDEPDVTFTVDTLEGAGNRIHLVSGDPEQHVSLTAEQPQSFQVEVCIVQEGSWPLEIRVVARHPDGSGWDAFEISHLESTLESGKLILSRDYAFSQQEYDGRPTPRPFDVSSECSDQTK